MQIAGRLVAEFECDSNAVGRVSSVLYPGRVRARTRRAGPRLQDRRDGAARGKKKNIQIRGARRLELESTYRRTRVCASGIVCEGARGRGKNIQISSERDTSRMRRRLCRAAFGRMIYLRRVLSAQVSSHYKRNDRGDVLRNMPENMPNRMVRAG